MLPATLAHNVREQILHYIGATFEFREKNVEKALSRFLEDRDNGIFKGPWVQLRRPYRPAPEGVPIPMSITTPFHPFKHQYKSWLRLNSLDRAPQSTIVTTGTGSGKTECFLYPLLDHCMRARQKQIRGIKAIVLYPMNALAADQEKRFAKAIWNDPVLKQAGLRVGCYVGRYDPANPGASATSGTTTMGQDHGISNHAAQMDNPPDILLTNYKMLDFLLMRPQDQALWRFNDPGVLQYLVLDELHTYDGAQGSDVACLIRRLKERLGVKKGDLCAVGTSATIDNRGDENRDARSDEGAAGGVAAMPEVRETSSDRLARFAGTLFEEDINASAIIGEDRLEVEEIVTTPQSEEGALPNPDDCEPLDFEDAARFAQRQSTQWGGPVFDAGGANEDSVEFAKALETWELALGIWMKKQPLFKRLLEIFHSAEKQRKDPLQWSELVDRVTEVDLRFRAVERFDDRHKLVGAFFSMVAQARDLRSGRSLPLVPTQVQLWVRELRRVGRIVSDAPAFVWLDEPPPGKKRCLPTFQCSECGESGWIGLHDSEKDSHIQAQGVSGFALIDDPAKIYRAYFERGGRSPNIVILSPWTATEVETKLPGLEQFICPSSLVVRQGAGDCPLTGDTQTFRVKVSRDTKRLESGKNAGKIVGAQTCPCCGTAESVFFIGTQGATLASLAVDELFGSVLNSDPKLLAFSDSVQDASHQAGFLSARTYRFTFRTALQHLIDDAGADGIKIPEVGKRLLDYWSEQRPGRPGSLRETVGALLPPDLREYRPYTEFRAGPAGAPLPPQLRKELEERLSWEAVSEFGLMQTHGRTMEKMGASCVRWDEKRVEQTLDALRAQIPGVSPELAGVQDVALRRWLYGILYRYRERGAMEHPYLLPFAKQGFWGKFPFGRAMTGRETYPSMGNYKPKLLVTGQDRDNENVMAATRGSRAPWHIVWARRALGVPNVDEATLLDLIREFFKCATEAGLLKRIHQDGTKEYFVLSAEAAMIVSNPTNLVCSQSERILTRPESEAALFENGPSLEYFADNGAYRRDGFNRRQLYYQKRYRKGALRRVVAQEHTGLLKTDEREAVEAAFSGAAHSDDPNVLTCTSTLEMGIDIGDLSSTMLCSIPPSTASYLQRIGRAGRATGTALIVAIVNQRPHDLFFFARPLEMLKGKVEPPGCWLDASAVLVRQYLGYCFDQATAAKALVELPRSGPKLVDDLGGPNGHLPRMLEWVGKNEARLHKDFLNRFHGDIQADTRDRLSQATETQVLANRIHQTAKEFDRQRRELLNARSRLQDQLDKLTEDERDARNEIQQELSIIRGRLSGLDRVSALEILIDNGLLPNYAFPERGVKFLGAIYNKYRTGDDSTRPIELVRGASVALRELAPHNRFYTHSREFEIQQVAIGNSQQPLIEEFAICGVCGHMRESRQLSDPGATPACPQCGHDGDSRSQMDQGQRKDFLEFSRSQAISYMEHYDSLCGDKSEERQREYYQIIRSFDTTGPAPTGAVGDDSLPFGIEYRASLLLRELNVGFSGQRGTIPFGPNQTAPDPGFQICEDCGVVATASALPEPIEHRRSCSARRRWEKARQEGREIPAFNWKSVYLYRQLQSEAIRLLLPLTSSDELDTLRACLYLGLRLRFQGDPAHVLIGSQIVPDPQGRGDKHYLVLMDAVPGGTGYLKTLYQEADGHGRLAEGIMDVMRRALNALETCSCRRLDTTDLDTDGCYRCLRAYHLQYNAKNISRERGIVRLKELIAAGEKRVEKESLAEVRTDSLFGSVLERRFVDCLRAYVEERQGQWESTIIRGAAGFRFSLHGQKRLWELELQPRLGLSQGVATQCQPDFMLHCDDSSIKPVAIFTDGFAYHVDKLSDDMVKRRAILQSGNYHVWSIAWEDLDAVQSKLFTFMPTPVEKMIGQMESAAHGIYAVVPVAKNVVRGGFEQLKAFLECPQAAGWRNLVESGSYFLLQLLVNSPQRRCMQTELKDAMQHWASGAEFGIIAPVESGEWIYNDTMTLARDLVTYVRQEHVFANRRNEVIIAARLGDSAVDKGKSDFQQRWQRFLATLNLYQFHSNFKFWASSEVEGHTAPEAVFSGAAKIETEWRGVWDGVASGLRSTVQQLAAAGVSLPMVEHYNPDIDADCFAELAWPDLKPQIALLLGEQADFSSRWQQRGWLVVLPDDLQAKGVDWLIEQLKKAGE
ncbi:MAG: DEAD/DEAH box helicase [Planctomycetota bacterium]